MDEAIRLAAFDWLTRQRLHQSAFRERVVAAYDELCSLRHRELLDAACDQSIVGVTPEYRIEIRQDILDETDGPMRRYGLQELHHRELRLPRSRHDWPDRDRLEQRYRSFRQAG